MGRGKDKEQETEEILALSGKAYDVVSHLEKEAKRCSKMSVLQYIRLRRLEQAESEQFGADVRGDLYATATTR